jgi:hypothetical protein
MVIQHKPASFPDEQLKMLSVSNRLLGVAVSQILPHVREDGTIWLSNLPACIQLLEAAFGDPDRVATAERQIRELKNRTMCSSSIMQSAKLLLPILIGIHRHW